MALTGRPSTRRTSRRAIRRRRATALLALLAAIGAASIAGAALMRQPSVAGTELEVDGRLVARVPKNAAASAVQRSLPATTRVRAGAVSTVYAIDPRRAAATVGRTGRSSVELPARAVAVRITAPAVAQRLRDNCETAALQVLLASTGVRVDQLTLQRQLDRSGPADPRMTSEGPVWGDPERGYVGRADGTGGWGGFGVYPGPVARLAARHGRRTRDLTGSRASSVYRALLGGHAVIAWTGLGDGPYREWITPDGRRTRVNLNEHTVVLTGMRRDGSLELVNVLRGTREVWSRSRFEPAWRLLGRRALATR